MSTQEKTKKWDKVEFGEVCRELIGGGTPSTKNASYWSGNIPWITSKWLGKGLCIENGEKLISEEAVKNSATHVVPKNSLLFATRVGVGKVGINKIPLAINQDLAGVILAADADPLFFAYQLQTDEIQKHITSLKRGATIQGITREDLKQIEINKPSLSEQKAIAKVLTTVQGAIAEQEKLIEKLKELKRSMMQHLFTRGTRGEKTKMTEIGEIPASWEVAALGEHLKKTKTKDPSKAPKVEFIYIDVSAVSREYFKIISAQKILGKDAPSRARKHIQTGDIIFATVRPTLQRIAVVPEAFNDQVCSTGYCVLRVKEDLDIGFLFHYLCGDTVLKYVEGLQSGASYPAIRDSILFALNIPFPSIEEQRVIGLTLSTISQRIELAQEKLSTYQDLFKTLLHELMSGERRVTI